MSTQISVSGPFAGLTEEFLLAEIAEYESRAEGLASPPAGVEPEMGMVYRTLAGYRRQLLAALRDGRPQAWLDYEPA